jgi:hypothetical protein
MPILLIIFYSAQTSTYTPLNYLKTEGYYSTCLSLMGKKRKKVTAGALSITTVVSITTAPFAAVFLM